MPTAPNWIYPHSSNQFQNKESVAHNSPNAKQSFFFRSPNKPIQNKWHSIFPYLRLKSFSEIHLAKRYAVGEQKRIISEKKYIINIIRAYSTQLPFCKWFQIENVLVSRIRGERMNVKIMFIFFFRFYIFCVDFFRFC